MIEINEAFLYKFLKFGIVGVSGMAVDFAVTFLCKEKVKVNKYIANTIGFFAGATNNFILNRVWTFKSHDPEISFQYFRFLTVSTIGVLMSNAIIYLLHEKWKWNFYLSKLFSIGIVLFWNFFANYFFTF